MPYFWNNLRITQRFIFVLCTFVLSVAAVAGVGLWGMASARDSLKTLYDEALARALQSEEIVTYATRNRMEVLLAFQHDTQGALAHIHTHPVDMHKDNITKNAAHIDKLLKGLESRISVAAERALYERVASTMQQWRTEMNHAMQAIHSGDYSAPMMERFLAAGRNQGESLCHGHAWFTRLPSTASQRSLSSGPKSLSIGTGHFCCGSAAVGAALTLAGVGAADAPEPRL